MYEEDDEGGDVVQRPVGDGRLCLVTKAIVLETSVVSDENLRLCFFFLAVAGGAVPFS